VTETLDFLEDANLLKKDREGNYVQTDKSISMGSVDAVPLAAKDLQRQMGELAVKALDLPLAERSMSGVVLGLTPDSYERIKQELLECRRRIIAIATESDKTQRVYRLNLQLFPISEPIDGRDVIPDIVPGSDGSRIEETDPGMETGVTKVKGN